MPVEILGFDGVPDAGEQFRVVENDREAKRVANERAIRMKQQALARQARRRVSLEDVLARAERGEKELNLVLKADVAGSLEALADEIARLPQEQVQVNIIREGVGGIAESDVMLASASDGVIIGFNVRPVGNAAQVADQEGVEIRTYSVIYKIVEDLRAAMEGLLEPDEVEEQVATVEVRATFKASRVGTIAGCYVTDGTVRRGAQCRLVRDGTVVYDRADRLAAALQGRRPRGDRRHGVRHRARELPRREGGGRDRGVRDQAGRADPVLMAVALRRRRSGLSFLCLIEIHLHFPDNGSLKGKRRELNSLKAQLQRRFGAAVAETDHHELWQRATLTAALVGRDAGDLHERGASLDPLRRFDVSGGLQCGKPCAVRSGPVGAVAAMADRMRRVNEAVREVVSARIAEGLKDPRIGFVTVTAVDTSPDLRHARVYVSVLGDEDERAATLAGLESAHGVLQLAVGSELRMKRTPTLQFVYDESIDRGMRITELLDEDA